MENDQSVSDRGRPRRVSASKVTNYRQFHLSGDLQTSIKGKVAKEVQKLNTPEKDKSKSVQQIKEHQTPVHTGDTVEHAIRVAHSHITPEGHLGQQSSKEVHSGQDSRLHLDNEDGNLSTVTDTTNTKSAGQGMQLDDENMAELEQLKEQLKKQQEGRHNWRKYNYVEKSKKKNTSNSKLSSRSNWRRQSWKKGGRSMQKQSRAWKKIKPRRKGP